jgi:hypothetical protein
MISRCGLRVRPVAWPDPDPCDPVGPPVAPLAVEDPPPELGLWVVPTGFEPVSPP